MDRTFKCPECGGPTKGFEVLGITLRALCSKCYDSELARQARQLASQNLARIAELDRQWRELCPPLFRATDPNHSAIDQDVLPKLLKWDPATAGGKGIGLRGPTGGCKTRMMFLLVCKLHYQGSKVRWIRAIDLSRASAELFDCDDAVRNRAREMLKNALRAEVLFIDDLGKERFTDRTELELYNLIETRISFLRPILWTTNAAGNDLLELMSQNRGPAIVRRLTEFSMVYFVQPLYERAKLIEQLATARSA